MSETCICGKRLADHYGPTDCQGFDVYAKAEPLASPAALGTLGTFSPNAQIQAEGAASPEPEKCSICGRGYWAHLAHQIDPDLAHGQGLESHQFTPAAQPPAPSNPGGEPTPAAEPGGHKAPKIADDPVYGPIRSEICEAYIAAGQPRPKENWLYSRLVEAKEEIRDYESLLELQRSRTIQADKLWQEAHNAPLTLPDLGGLVEWLLQRAESAEQAVAQARKELQDVVSVLKSECDRTWDDETPYQIAVIAVNAAYRKGTDETEARKDAFRECAEIAREFERRQASQIEARKRAGSGEVDAAAIAAEQSRQIAAAIEKQGGRQ